MRKFWHWRYQLESSAPLNSVTARRTYEGALVRMGEGFGCLHPWPELGDPTLDECLQDLAGPQESRLVRRTLACLAADGVAREEGRSLFEGLTVPESHATLTALDERAVGVAVGNGFRVVKVKVGRNIKYELERVRQLGHLWPDLRWRLDFNGAGTAKELIDHIIRWKDSERKRIDFLEDPVPYDSPDWTILVNTIDIHLANDRRMSDDRGDSHVLIVKPAVEAMPDDERSCVVTSYLDHPLGQCFAAWEAARQGVREVCGLQTHGAFQPNSFTEVLGGVTPSFSVPGGAGLGFGELLRDLPWL